MGSSLTDGFSENDSLVEIEPIFLWQNMKASKVKKKRKLYPTRGFDSYLLETSQPRICIYIKALLKTRG